jgi:hypothetical protein
MKIIATKLAKNDKYDQLRCIRSNGSETSTLMPRQGVLPHDLIHYVVENTLGYDHAFFGLVAKGADISFAMAQSHDIANQAVACQATHAEAIVESLQAQLWSGNFDIDMFLAGLAGACEMRSQPVPDLSRVDVKSELYAGVMSLAQHWQQLPFHDSIELEMAGL